MIRFVKASALARESWLKSREADDYRTFQPAFETLVDLLKGWISYTGYEEEPYNTLIDLYEPDKAG